MRYKISEPRRSGAWRSSVSCVNWSRAGRLRRPIQPCDGIEIMPTNPRLFVSYSWSSPDHEAWVVQLATELREAGIDVVLDKWDLKEGHDADAFMEKMVAEPDIKKVILICDKAYVDKTNGRTGGAGTEAYIISSEIYASQAHDELVP